MARPLLGAPARARAVQSHIVQLFLHREQGDLGARDAIMDARLWANVPDAIRAKIGDPPCASYKFAKPVSLQICNYSRVSELSQDATARILEGDCVCGRAEFADHLVDGHVLTTDSTIMGNRTLATMMAKGAKYRCETHEASREVEVGAVMNGVVYADLERALNKWRAQMETLHGLGTARGLLPWAQAVLGKVRADPRVLRKPATAADDTLTEYDLRRLKLMQERFCFSTVDKASGNYSILCKKRYIQLCMAELEGGETYTVSNRTVEELREEGRAYCTDMHKLTPQRKSRVPNFHIRMKAHKQPIGSRFVAGSSKAPLTPVSKALNMVCKTLTPYLEELWNDKATVIPGVTLGSLQGKTGFVIENTAQAATFIMKKQRPRQQRSPPLLLETFDFTTLYTALQHEELKERVTDILTRVFRANTPGVDADSEFLYVRDNGTHYWIPQPQAHHTHKYRFNLTQCVDMLNKLVDGSYVKFAGRTWHQRIGIPMGSNCSGYLANFLLYSYELAFLSKQVAEQNWQVEEGSTGLHTFH